jgi:hypothetical protein
MGDTMKKFFIVSAIIFLGVIVLAKTAPAADSTFHGQFRINSYYLSVDPEGAPDDMSTQANRLRYRPTWDVSFDNGVKLHLQLNIGHINSNMSQTGPSPVGCGVCIRHGLVSTPLPMEGWTLVGGLIPYNDKFGQTLFSGDWDFNPLAFALIGKLAAADVTLLHGNVAEGLEGVKDDVEAWILDIDFPVGLGVSFYGLIDQSMGMNPSGDIDQYYFGARYAQNFNDVAFNAFIVFNTGTFDGAGAGGADIDNEGVAVQLQVKIPVGAAKIGLQGVYATGDGTDFGSADSDAFISPQSIYGGHGYWGYAGKLNVQGPTDTGIDDPVRIDGGSYSNANLGTGILSLQANASFNIVPDTLDGYFAIAWMAQEDEVPGMDDSIGFDIIAMGNYHFGAGLNLEFGIDYLSADKGHHGGEADSFLAFSRFQLEY